VKANAEVDSRAKPLLDALLSKGHRISNVLVTAALNQAGESEC
jgi:hypothetical protein